MTSFQQQVHFLKGHSYLKVSAGRTLDAFHDGKALANKLKREHQAKGRILNYYGRPLYFSRSDDHLLVSHYIQSTGVDVCLSGFSNVIEKIKRSKMRSVPIFLIHDALLLDVPDDELPMINELTHVGSRVEKFDIDFPLNVSDAVGESFNLIR